MKKLTYEDFVKKGNEIHNNKYDYSKTDLNNRDEKGKVIITCPIHGDFKQRPHHHISRKQGCPICGNKKVWEKRIDKTTTEEIIKRMKEKYNNYSFDKNTEIKTQKQKITVTCSKHGDFISSPDSILHNHGCPKCAAEDNRKRFAYSKEKIIELAKKIHKDEYTYEGIEYVNIDEPIEITCPIHGKFKQSPYAHIYLKQGCPFCNKSHLEKEISDYLTDKSIKYVQGQRFDWLGRQHLDFYLPQYNVAIECQGEQHFKPIEKWGGKETLDKTKERDIRKKILCEQNNIKLLYFTHYKDVEETQQLFKNKKTLLNFIIYNENNATR